MTQNLRQAALQALAAGLETAKGKALCDQKGYTVSLADNLVDGVTLEQFQHDFEGGAGQELQTKMRAAHSSSALAVNCFGRWAPDPTSLHLGGQSSFDTLQFEAKCPTGLTGRTPPHLDLVVRSPSTVIALESKCTEYLVKHRAKFATAYRDQITDARVETGWFAEMELLRDQPQKYRFLDAAQLIKHYFGLARTYSAKPITLLYLFWEPANAHDFPTFAEHRAEISEFTKAVAGSSVAFKAQSYPELWATWDQLGQPTWLATHLASLRARYEVTI